MSSNNRQLAIIGIGPRGGFAFENIILELIERNAMSHIHFLLFEETGNFGNGAIWDVTQEETNWVNIHERALELEGRKQIRSAVIDIPAFPSYHEWIGIDFSKLSDAVADSYPPRATLGRYLKERFETLAKPLLDGNWVTLIEEKVIKVDVLESKKLQIKTSQAVYKDVDELLLTIGHQPTKLTEEMISWEKYSSQNENVTLFKNAYPVKAFLYNNALDQNATVAVRGFGLAMIDVVRAIAEKFGAFTRIDEDTHACNYHSELNIKGMIVPFSLDGLPPVPKPFNAAIDAQFKPSDIQLKQYGKTISQTTLQNEANSPSFLLAAFAPIAVQVFMDLNHKVAVDKTANELETIIMRWLEDPTKDYEGMVPLNASAMVMMQNYVDMATGKAPISLDYCIGQVWRHCQPTMYEKLSFNKCSDEVFASIIEIDEQSKRFSYGPPVAAIQQLLALIEQGILSIDFLKEPEIELTNAGWKFIKNKKDKIITILIDSVLDAPKVDEVSSPLVEHLLDSDIITEVHDELGIDIEESGLVCSEIETDICSIALLGRLAKGTVIGVDAMLECFGPRPKKWATAAAKRHTLLIKNYSNEI